MRVFENKELLFGTEVFNKLIFILKVSVISSKFFEVHTFFQLIDTIDKKSSF
jgi:hypothetical protein